MWRRGLAVGGVLCLVLVVVALSQDRRGPRGFGPPIDNVALLSMPEVQRELGLDDARQKQVGEWIGQTQEQLRAANSDINFAELGTATEEEREKVMGQWRAKTEGVMKQADEKLRSLLEPKQFERLLQLRWQREGVQAMLRDDIA